MADIFLIYIGRNILYNNNIIISNKKWTRNKKNTCATPKYRTNAIKHSCVKLIQVISYQLTKSLRIRSTTITSDLSILFHVVIFMPS